MSSFAERYGPWGVVAGASDGTGAAFGGDLGALAEPAQAVELVSQGVSAMFANRDG